MNRPPITEIVSFVPRPGQLSKARELLGWSVSTACISAKITAEQLARLEADPRGGDGLIMLETAYRAAGVAFAMFAGPSGTIYKTRLSEGPWHHFTQRGPMGKRSAHA